jgi:hypothetical protein
MAILLPPLRAAPGPAPQQHMSVPALRHAVTVGGGVGQHIALDYSDCRIEIGQHTRGPQPAHTCPQDQRIVADLRHTALPNHRQPQQKSSMPRAEAPVVWALNQGQYEYLALLRHSIEFVLSKLGSKNESTRGLLTETCRVAMHVQGTEAIRTCAPKSTAPVSG